MQAHGTCLLTYTGVMLEAKNWIQPLLDNQALQKSFLTYSKSPRLKQKLETLLNYVCSYMQLHTLCYVFVTYAHHNSFKN